MFDEIQLWIYGKINKLGFGSLGIQYVIHICIKISLTKLNEHDLINESL